MNELKFGNPLVVGSLSSDPSPAFNGEIYYNNVSNVFRIYQNGAFATIGTGSGSGTVTSVQLAEGSEGNSQTILAFSGTNPITSSGTIDIAFASQATGNWVLATPNGSSGQPFFRALVSADIPSLSSLYLALTGGTMSGAINMGSNKITNLANGSAAQDAATYGQLQNAMAGIEWRPAVNLYDNIDTTPPSTTATLIDGVTVTNGMRVLFVNLSSGNNEVYLATVSGSSISWAAQDDNLRTTPVPSTGDAILVLQGTSFADSAWVYSGTAFVQFNGGTQIQPGNALSKSGNTLNVLYDNSTISLNGSNQLYVPTAGIGSTQLASASVTAAKLATVTDGVTLDQSGAGSTLEIKAGGVSNTQVASNAAIAYSKLAALSTDIIPSTDHTNGFLESSDVSNAKTLISNGFNRGVSTSAVVSELYTDSTTLTDNTSSPATAFSFAVATYAGQELTYIIETGAGTPDIRIGTIRVSANANGGSLSDMFTETADCGVAWSVSVASGTASIQYTTTNQGSNRTMRADIKSFRK